MFSFNQLFCRYPYWEITLKRIFSYLSFSWRSEQLKKIDQRFSAGWLYYCPNLIFTLKNFLNIFYIFYYIFAASFWMDYCILDHFYCLCDWNSVVLFNVVRWTTTLGCRRWRWRSQRHPIIFLIIRISITSQNCILLLFLIYLLICISL